MVTIDGCRKAINLSLKNYDLQLKRTSEAKKKKELKLGTVKKDILTVKKKSLHLVVFVFQHQNLNFWFHKCINDNFKCILCFQNIKCSGPDLAP